MKFWNKVLFEQRIKKIKSESVRNYFLTFLSVKQIFTKLILFLLVSLVVVTIAFTAREFAINQHKLGHWRILLNSGVAFSGLADKGAVVVKVIQGLPVFITLIGFIFVNNPMIYVPLVFMSLGGMCNFVDRFIDEPQWLLQEYGKSPDLSYVVDYIPMRGSVVNFQDIVVVTSSVIFAVNCVILVILLVVNESKKSKSKEKQAELKIKEYEN